MQLSTLSPEPCYFEDLEIGTAFDSPTRTVTEADVVNFACLSADFNRLHVDAEYAKGTPHGQRIAHGLLVLAVMSGLVTRMQLNQHLEPSLLGLLDIQCRFPRPTFIGDTLRVRAEVATKSGTSRPDRGVVAFHRQVINQRDEVVVEGTWKLLVRRRPALD
ncbi:MaoC/PaaZ C-terminal domain-containing protein [Piscinibacter koreensis]|jgi:acyl dehydratase|uniref:MaoC family dehydratase N-terminal domain-containing protein n=1 Tax=Piscinibacter koreensis TaxID=2742824 RepID=A0A7Y6TZ56_9BURK|nr:MaoC/PaaZ C-terminal domain-containing protein [Schlegelella koreensis]NUZ08780.1 MaoC family dehydratase N-terminal domain-containing protein [Schlegelella koreensis]